MNKSARTVVIALTVQVPKNDCAVGNLSGAVRPKSATPQRFSTPNTSTLRVDRNRAATSGLSAMKLRVMEGSADLPKATWASATTGNIKANNTAPTRYWTERDKAYVVRSQR